MSSPGAAPRLTSVSFAHPRVGAARRAEVSLPGPHTEAFFLTTCLRVEVAWAGDVAVADLPGDGVVRHDDAAFRHLARVAAGLDSPVVGEPEVLGQFRRAVADVADRNQTLTRLLESAVAVARSARRHIGDVPAGSLASVAADRVREAGPVAVLGGGAMARAAVAHLDGVDVTVFARKPGLVAGLTPRPWSEVAHALVSFPAVVSTIPGKRPLLSDGGIETALRSRSSALRLVDLGMPPMQLPENPVNLDYLCLDDLAAGVTAPLAAEAEAVLVDLAADTWRRSVDDRAGPVIAAVLGRADVAVAEEVRRFAGRLANADDPEEVLQQVARTVARRLLHPAVTYLNTTDDASIEVVAQALGVEP